MLDGSDDLDLDLYFPPSSSRRRKGLKEVPNFVRIITLTGIICLAVAFVISVILASGFEQPENNDTLFVSSDSRNALIIILICFGVLGFFLSSFVWYGHYLRSKYDPKNIVKGPMNIINFPNIDRDIKVNDFRERDLKPRFYYSGAKNRLRNEFL
jgi:magnesium-transporting ATPase (P-type)